MTVHAQDVLEKTLVSAVTQTSGETTDAYVDCLGANYAVLRVNITKGATATIASADGASIKVVTSADTNFSNGVTVAANETALKLTKTSRYYIDMRNKARYLIARTISGSAGVSNDNQTIQVNATLSRLEQGPATTTAMTTGNTNDSITIC